MDNYNEGMNTGATWTLGSSNVIYVRDGTRNSQIIAEKDLIWKLKE